MAVDRDLVERLLQRSEGESLDFKQRPYDLNADDCDFLKDLLAMANAPRRGDAHIVVGVREEDGRAVEVVGVSEHLRDHTLQQYTNSEKRLNRRVVFDYTAVTMEVGKEVGVLRIEVVRRRPIYVRRGQKRLGTAEPETVYIRRGQSTNIASPDDIAEMGHGDSRTDPTDAELLATWAEKGLLPELTFVMPPVLGATECKVNLANLADAPALHVRARLEDSDEEQIRADIIGGHPRAVECGTPLAENMILVVYVTYRLGGGAEIEESFDIFIDVEERKGSHGFRTGRRLVSRQAVPQDRVQVDAFTREESRRETPSS